MVSTKRTYARPLSTLHKSLLAEAQTQARFWSKVEKGETCWTWQATRSDLGYGRFNLGDTTVAAHRIAFYLVRGQFDESKTLDHLCRNTSCVNPEHLEPVTMKENILRGNGRAAEQARKTHCYNGHPLSGDNLISNGPKKPRRRCKECNRVKFAIRRRRTREQRISEGRSN